MNDPSPASPSPVAVAPAASPRPALDTPALDRPALDSPALNGPTLDVLAREGPASDGPARDGPAPASSAVHAPAIKAPAIHSPAASGSAAHRPTSSIANPTTHAAAAASADLVVRPRRRGRRRVSLESVEPIVAAELPAPVPARNDTTQGDTNGVPSHADGVHGSGNGVHGNGVHGKTKGVLGGADAAGGLGHSGRTLARHFTPSHRGGSNRAGQGPGVGRFPGAHVDLAAMPVIDPTIRVPVISQREFDIRHYGAAGNGTTDNTDAIVNAVTSAFESGGGRVVVPGGSWLTGPIALLSGVELSLDEHAELRMIGDAGLFQSPEADRGLLGAWLPLILARGCSGVALTGRGRIACGDATHWIAQPVSRSRGRKPIDLPAPHPALFKAIACDGLVIEHLRFDTGACVSAVSVSGSRHVTIRHITVSSVPRQDRPAGGIDTRQAESRAPGVMIDSSSEVVVEECDVSADGDGVVVRSRQPLPSSGGADSSLPTPVASLAPVATPATGPDALEPRPASTAVVEDERGPGTVDEAAGATPVARPRRRRHDEASVDLVPSRDIVLRRLRVSGGAAAVVIGDVHGGGVSNVLVEQCYCDGVRLGVRIEAPRRRGQVVENVVIRNTAMGRIDGQAILLATGPASPSPSTLAAPVCRNIHLSGVECRDAREAVRMVGANQGALRQIRLENVAIASEEGLFCSGSRDVMLIDVRISPRFGPVLSLRDTVGVTIQGMSGAPGGNVFLDLRGRHTRDVRIMGDAHESIRPAVVIGVEVPRDALVHE